MINECKKCHYCYRSRECMFTRDLVTNYEKGGSPDWCPLKLDWWRDIIDNLEICVKVEQIIRISKK